MQRISIRRGSESNALNEFRIIRFQDAFARKDMEEGLHRHDFFFLMVLEASSGRHHIDFTKYPVESNTVTIIRPGQVHELHLRKGSKGYLITFSPNFYKSDILRKVAMNSLYNVTPAAVDSVLGLCQSIFVEFSNKAYNYNRVMRAYLDILFILMSRMSHEMIPAKSNEEQEVLDELLYLLDSQVTEKKRVADYAKELRMSSYKLNTVTKNLLGKTCSQLIHEHIVLEAKRQLLATSSQVNEIAFNLGFEDPAYFIRFFRKHTNHTPKAFRQNFMKAPFF